MREEMVRGAGCRGHLVVVRRRAGGVGRGGAAAEGCQGGELLLRQGRPPAAAPLLVACLGSQAVLQQALQHVDEGALVVGFGSGALQRL